MRRPPDLSVTLFLALVLPAFSLHAQGSTGRIRGTVTDARGNPVAGARIRLWYLHRDARSDASGRYALADVPVGTNVVIVQAAAYRPDEIRNVPVTSGATTILDVALHPPDPVYDGDTVVGPRTDPLSPGARTVLPRDVLARFPADDISRIVAFQPGVVEASLGTDPVVRGGIPGEAAVYLDGVPLRTAASLNPLDRIAPHTIEELTVAHGALGSRFGDAQAGLINVVTRSGGQRLEGSVSYDTDELFGAGTSVGHHRFEGSIGGRIADRVAWFGAATLQGREAALRGAGTNDVLAFVPGSLDTVVEQAGFPPVEIPRFVQVSGDCEARDNYERGCRGRAFPRDWSTFASATGRVDLLLGATRISLTGLWDLQQGRRWPGALTFDPEAQLGGRTTTQTLIGTWSQSLPAGLEARVDVSHQQARVVAGVLGEGWAMAHGSPTAGILLGDMGFLVDFDRFSPDTGTRAIRTLGDDAAWDALVQNVLTNTGTRVPFLDSNALRTGQAYRLNPWAVAAGFPTRGVDVPQQTVLANERHWLVRGRIGWQMTAQHYLELGVEHTTSRINSFSGRLLSQTGMSVFAESPRQLGLYAQERFETDRFTLEVGGRWERFDPRTAFPLVPGRIFSSPDFDPADPVGSVFEPAEVHTAFSPRIRGAVAVTRTTALHAAYGHYTQNPPYPIVFGGKNRDLSFASTSDGFGGDLGWARTILFELGIRQRLGNGFAVDAAGFRKEKRAEPVIRYTPIFDPQTGREVLILVPSTFDTGHVTGVEGGVQLVSARWNGRVAYSFQDADGSVGRGLVRRHAIRGWLGVRWSEGEAGLLGGTGLFATFRLASGLPYTPLVNQGVGELGPGALTSASQLAAPLLSAATPWLHEVDLRVTHSVRFRGIDLTVFGDFRNLLGFRNVLRVFAETGGVANDVFRERVLAPAFARLINEAGAAYTQILKDGEMIDAVDLSGYCSTWGGGPVNCVALRRAEARWGNGDGIYDVVEQRVAFGAMYDLLYGPWTLQGQPRHARLGIEIAF